MYNHFNRHFKSYNEVIIVFVKCNNISNDEKLNVTYRLIIILLFQHKK